MSVIPGEAHKLTLSSRRMIIHRRTVCISASKVPSASFDTLGE